MGSSLRYLLISIGVLSVSYSNAAPLKSLHAKSRVTRTQPGAKPTVEIAETWIKDGKMRTKMGTIVRILDGRNQMLFKTDDPQRRLQVSALPPDLQNTDTFLLLNRMIGAPPQWKRKKVGTAKIMNFMTTIYQVSSPNANQTIKLWMTSQPGGPIPLKQTMSDASGTLTSEVFSLEINPALSDSLFTAPKGFKKISLPSPSPELKPSAPNGAKTKKP
jgi:outer membrane lipoprotein-sorting protein